MLAQPAAKRQQPVMSPVTGELVLRTGLLGGLLGPGRRGSVFLSASAP